MLEPGSTTAQLILDRIAAREYCIQVLKGEVRSGDGYPDREQAQHWESVLGLHWFSLVKLSEYAKMRDAAGGVEPHYPLVNHDPAEIRGLEERTAHAAAEGVAFFMARCRAGLAVAPTDEMPEGLKRSFDAAKERPDQVQSLVLIRAVETDGRQTLQELWAGPEADRVAKDALVVMVGYGLEGDPPDVSPVASVADVVESAKDLFGINALGRSRVSAQAIASVERGVADLVEHRRGAFLSLVTYGLEVSAGTAAEDVTHATLRSMAGLVDVVAGYLPRGVPPLPGYPEIRTPPPRRAVAARELRQGLT